LIEDRSSGDGFVVETPLIWSVALAGLRYRSIGGCQIVCVSDLA